MVKMLIFAYDDDCNKGRVREGEKDEEYGNEEYMNRCSRKHRVEEVSILIIITVIIREQQQGEGVPYLFAVGKRPAPGPAILEVLRFSLSKTTILPGPCALAREWLRGTIMGDTNTAVSLRRKR